MDAEERRKRKKKERKELQHFVGKRSHIRGGVLHAELGLFLTTANFR